MKTRNEIYADLWTIHKSLSNDTGLTMKLLLELVRTLNKNKTKNISVISYNKAGKTKLDKFYRALADGKLTTDEEAFAYLYPGQKDLNPYYKLKHQLRERLYQTAFFVDIKRNKYDNRDAAFLECQVTMMLAKLLIKVGASENYFKLAKKLAVLAEKYQFTTEHLFALSVACGSYTMSGQTSKVIETNKKIRELLQLLSKETIARAHWRHVSSMYVADRSKKPEVQALIDQYLVEIETIPCTLDSAFLSYTVCALNLAKHMSTNDYAGAVPHGEKGLTAMRILSFPYSSAVFTIGINLTACYIALKEFEKGEHSLQEMLPFLSVGTYNWFKYLEFSFLLSIHTKRYRKAYDTYLQVVNHPKFKRLPTIIRETWTISSAYLYLLHQTGRLPEWTDSKSFRIQRYLNDVPTFMKDKRGQNVPILISQFVLLLQRKDYDGVLDRYEATMKYRDRYLDKEKNFRANVFFRIMAEVTRSNFTHAPTLRRTNDYRSMLDEVPVGVLQPTYDQEILPYEDLYEIILELL